MNPYTEMSALSRSKIWRFLFSNTLASSYPTSPRKKRWPLLTIKLTPIPGRLNFHWVNGNNSLGRVSLGLLQRGVITVIMPCLVISICYFYMLKAAWVRIKRTTEKKACSVNRDETVALLRIVPLSCTRGSERYRDCLKLAGWSSFMH